MVMIMIPKSACRLAMVAMASLVILIAILAERVTDEVEGQLRVGNYDLCELCRVLSHCSRNSNLGGIASFDLDGNNSVPQFFTNSKSLFSIHRPGMQLYRANSGISSDPKQEEYRQKTYENKQYASQNLQEKGSNKQLMQGIIGGNSQEQRGSNKLIKRKSKSKSKSKNLQEKGSTSSSASSITNKIQNGGSSKSAFSDKDKEKKYLKLNKRSLPPRKPKSTGKHTKRHLEKGKKPNGAESDEPEEPAEQITTEVSDQELQDALQAAPQDAPQNISIDEPYDVPSDAPSDAASDLHNNTAITILQKLKEILEKIAEISEEIKNKL